MPGRDPKRNQQGNYGSYGYSNGRGGGTPRNHVIPNEPPFTAYIGNAPDSMVQGDFETHLFVGLKIKQVRLVRDRQTDRFRGFAYVDFEDADSLRRAIDLDGTCINDRPIRIDVAVRPLGATKSEGFRKKPGFEAGNNRCRNPSGNSNTVPRYSGRSNSNYNPPETPYNVEDGYHDDYPVSGHTRQPSGSSKPIERRNSQTQQNKTTLAHQVSNDDVFIAPDTPTSNEDGVDQETTTMIRQQSRNWADCPIDESVTESSPPPSVNNTFTNDEFQVVRNKNVKSHPNQHFSSGSMGGNQSGRGRNNGNFHRGNVSQMSGGRGFYDQFSSQYSDQSQQFYHYQHGHPSSLHTGMSYHMNNNNNNNHSHNRQRVNSNRSNRNNRNYSDNDRRLTKGLSESSTDHDSTSVSAENRPRLQLLPRSQKLSSSTDDNQTSEPVSRSANIFGSGKPRDERDPKLMELNKHIEEVVEKEQHVPRTKSTASNESTEGVAKPVRILTASTGS
ncbi:unnamed protein product [Adineta ricciae]|uniref:Eukaryotic translation initiation factor 4H n=1 Tax=Adineta ricciae TaxID=249248 RepID=A0A813Y359_ADIRI|nr:unnamed protein product [Adineta ricciae]CAF0950428.1 unnamed protein product [Adineta ricciae]